MGAIEDPRLAQPLMPRCLQWSPRLSFFGRRGEHDPQPVAAIGDRIASKPWHGEAWDIGRGSWRPFGRWENHRKTIGKPWGNDGLMELLWNLPSGKLLRNYGKWLENGWKSCIIVIFPVQNGDFPKLSMLNYQG